MIIRQARADEARVLQDLNDILFVDSECYDPDLDMTWALSPRGEKYFTKLLKNPRAHCLIAEEKGKPIGYITAVPKKTHVHTTKSLEIANLIVLPLFRSRGVGSALIARVFMWAKEKKYDKLYVSAYFHSVRAVKFYKQSGFSEIDLGMEMTVR